MTSLSPQDAAVDPAPTGPAACPPSLPPSAAGGPKLLGPVAGGKPAAGPGFQFHPAAKAMSEDDLDRAIRRIVADLPGVLRYHTFDSRKSPSGYPDLTLCGPGGVLFRELKRQGKNPTPAQDEWLCTLTEGGADADVWRPSDLLSGRIARELAAISGISRLTRPREARGEAQT